ncbi:MAG: carboxy terminal-processing peptidase [Steroidobacteraceae bacterium]
MLSIAAGMVLVLGLSNSSHAPITIAAAAADTGGYAPTEKQRRVSKLVSAVIERSHYRQSAINDPVSSVMLDRYLESLDPARSYFTASDIKEFEHIRYQLDDAVISGTVDPAFTVYNRFQNRNRERLNYALELLKQQPDFTIDESFEYDRSKSPWPQNEAELNELWRKRVKNDALSLMLTGKSWTEAQDLLHKRYERAVKNLDKITNEDVFDIFMNSFAHVFDPHSNYFSPRNSDEFKIQMSLSYEGIGASLSVVDDFVVVQNVIAGGAAAVSGLINANDRITAVGEGKDGKLVDVGGWRIDDVVQLIRGKGGTTVRLQILPAGAAPGSTEKVISLVRSKISLEAQAAKQNIRTIKRDGKDIKVGIITVPSFYQDTDAAQRGDPDYRSLTRDVRKLIEGLKSEGVQAIVMDLRADGGGNLQEAIGLTGLFIGTGPVVQVRQTGGQIEALDDTDNHLAWNGPLTVLIDRYSASASEIFSGAIQDYGRGLVIGQQSYGKGTVQNVYPLDRFAANKEPGFGQLTITTGKFYRITGESTQHRGVEPDITLASAISVDDVGESTQESALPWDRIRPASFVRSNDFKPILNSLMTAHEQRIAQDPNYQYLLQNISAYDALRKTKSISLNLKTRQEERENQDKTRLERENQRRRSLGLQPVSNLEALEKEEAPDALLAEAAEITADLDLWWDRGRNLNAAAQSAKSN